VGAGTLAAGIATVAVFIVVQGRRPAPPAPTDVAVAALDAAHRRLVRAGHRNAVTLLRASLDQPWPANRYDLVVLSEVCYYLDPGVLRAVMDREVPQLAAGATVLAAHWRHPVVVT